MTTKLLLSAALAALVAAPALAQGALVGTDALDDRVDDIRSDIDDEFTEANDASRFGFGQVRQGFGGGGFA